MVCCSSFPSFRGENHPDPKSSQDLDPDKPVLNTSCWGDETYPIFLCAFFWIRVSGS